MASIFSLKNKWHYKYGFNFSLFICVFFLSCTALSQSSQQTFTKDNFKEWLNIAHIASATYKSNIEIDKVFNTHGYQVQHTHIIKDFSVAYTLATNHTKKTHFIAIRGTSNTENVIVDASFVLTPDSFLGIRLHQGFLLSAKSIYEEIKNQLDPTYTINMTGHSMGGAVAVIIAMLLDKNKFNLGEIVTFGQPKVTNISGSRKFQHLNIKRLVTPKDIIPLVPPIDPLDLMNVSIFWHIGIEIVLFKDNQYSVLTGISSMMRATDFLNDTPEEKHLSNHFMSTYISNLESKIKNPVEVKFKSDFKISDWFNPTPDKK